VRLPELQYEIVKRVIGGPKKIDEIAEEMGKKKEDLMRPVAELEKEGLVEVVRREVEAYELSPLGEKYLKEELPEEKLLKLVEGNEVDLKKLKEVMGDEAGVAIGLVKRLGLGEVKEGKLILKNIEGFKEYAEKVRGCLERAEPCPELRKRGFLKRIKATEIIVKPTEKLLELWNKGEIKVAKVITALTSELILSGAWKDATFKEFDLSVEFPVRRPKRRHPLLEVHEHVKEVLVSMGFEEVRGDYVDYALWNFDVLLVPQFHPARSETDVFYVSNVRPKPVEEDVMEKTAKEHERMWGYWKAEIARKLLLRTHTTVVTARTLYERGGGEYRIFSLDRVFRSETLDPTHSMEFHQLEGIVVGKEVKFKHLLGFFEEFAKKMGLGEVFFKPAYFPFTEPSVEGFIRHPKVGWVEVFPGGMFRPEMLRIVGLEGYQVAAWGIGIDRIAMMLLGLDDIRDLYTNDLDVIRKIKMPKLLMRGR